MLFAPCPGVAQAPAPPQAADHTVIYVARRGWHIDIGFAVGDMQPPLKSLAKEFPGMRYLFFGFGDRRYFLAKHRNAPVLLAALWPGPGLFLVTALAAPPQDAFGTSHVASLSVTLDQARSAQSFIWQSLEKQASDEQASDKDQSSIQPYAAGPYEGSLYFATPLKYSASHTCNTWAAEALKAASLPVRSAGVVLAGQLWSQVQGLEKKQFQLQGGFVPSWQTTVIPES